VPTKEHPVIREVKSRAAAGGDQFDLADALKAVDQRLTPLTHELKGLNDRIESGERSHGVQERAANVAAALAKAQAERAELAAEWRDAMRDGMASGRVGYEPGDGHGSVDGGRLSGRYGAAKRVIDANVKSGLLPDHAAEKAVQLVEHGPERDRSLAARWAVAAGDQHYLKAFAKLLADPERGHLLWTEREGDAYRRAAEVQAELKAMSLTDASGGYMVPLTLDPAILLTSAGSINPLRRISRVVRTLTEAWQGVTSAGATAEWKAEAAEAADASPTLAPAPIPVHFGDAFVPYSYEIGMDALNFAGELQTVLIDAAEQLMATAYTTGTGSGQPTGIITAIVGTASVVVGTEAFPSSQVYSLQNALPPRFQARAQWCAALPIINLLSQRETTAGARLFPGGCSTGR
jgi:predicted phage gp36 major capsid-like protein